MAIFFIMSFVFLLCNLYLTLYAGIFFLKLSIILCAILLLSELMFDVSILGANRVAIKAFLFKHRFAGLYRIIC